MNRTVERSNLHSRHLYQSKRKFVLYKTIESFFEFPFIFRVIHFFLKNVFLPDSLIFFRIRKLKKKTLYSFLDHEIPLLLIPVPVL